MCGRFNVTDDPATHALLQILGFDLHLPVRYNIAPTEAVPVVIRGNTGNEIHEMRWWLTPSWAPAVSTQYSMFNAKSETLDSSRAFKGPFRHHRGIMPASSFIEWRTEKGGKQPYLIRPVDGAFAFAALWDVWEKSDSYLESCAMITTAAVPDMQWLHQRMPVMLAPEDFEQWLNPATDIKSLLPLFASRLPVAMEAVPIDRRINNGKEKSSDLLAPSGFPVEIKLH